MRTFRLIADKPIIQSIIIRKSLNIFLVSFFLLSCSTFNEVPNENIKLIKKIIANPESLKTFPTSYPEFYDSCYYDHDMLDTQYLHKEICEYIKNNFADVCKIKISKDGSPEVTLENWNGALKFNKQPLIRIDPKEMYILFVWIPENSKREFLKTIDFVFLYHGGKYILYKIQKGTMNNPFLYDLIIKTY